MDHFSPHPASAFEGFYTKLDLPSKGHLVLVISTVPNVSTRPYLVSFTYVPPEYPSTSHFQRELFVDDIRTEEGDEAENTLAEKEKDSPAISFRLNVPNIGHMTVYSDSSSSYSLRSPTGEWEFSARVPASIGAKTNRTSWIRGDGDSTPEGWLARLPLPLHWHVQTIASECTFELAIASNVYSHLHPLDRSTPSPSTSPEVTLPGPATIHQEKNWAHSFPSSHNWLRAHNPTTKSSICLAGGRTMGVDAFLITYHSPSSSSTSAKQELKYDVSFKPPFALSIPFPPRSWSPTLSTDISWRTRTLTLTTSNLTHRLSIHASAPPDTFIGLSAPFYDGHRPNFLAQSYKAKVEVKVMHRRRGLLGLERVVGLEILERVFKLLGSIVFMLFGFHRWRGEDRREGGFAVPRLGLGWKEVCTEVFEGASLEFGGDAYEGEGKGIVRHE